MMKYRASVALTIALMAASLTACVRAKAPATHPSGSAPISSLWVAPTDMANRNLYYGPWGAEHAPDPNDTYRFVERKHSGVNLGLTVRDSKGREWSVKQPYPGAADFEGPVEVAVSRLLSAAGYHQPPVYFLKTFTLKDDWGTHIEPGGRFRLDDDTLDSAGIWSWQENPFIGTRPYQGLLVLMMMVNNTDLKNTNNTLYERKRGDLVQPWYVVRDVGAALGDTERFAPRKGHPAAFESHPFILGVRNGHVEFAYKGWYQKLVRDRVSAEDVAWISNLLAQLSDRQWQDAFRAAGYERAVADRFIRTLQKKVAEGQNLGRRAAAE